MMVDLEIKERIQVRELIKPTSRKFDIPMTLAIAKYHYWIDQIL
jgi:hypothetical protein